MALSIDIVTGMILHSRVRPMRLLLIERAMLRQVQGIVVHQTDALTAAATFHSYQQRGAKGAHFLIDKDGTVYQTASLFKTTVHVGALRPRCIDELTCRPSQFANVARGEATH